MTVMENIKKKLGGKIVSAEEVTKGKFYLEILPGDILAAAGILQNELGLRFVTATGTDARFHIEILYHFADDSKGDIVSLRTQIKDKKNPSIDSIAPVFRGAEWIEREMFEMLGIKFIGHPGLKHLLLIDEWPKDNFPLRHDNERK